MVTSHLLDVVREERAMDDATRLLVVHLVLTGQALQISASDR